ncbi:three-helix bundle dimerization domain-containing protein [Streptomyces sp. NBC_00654]|uniref:three-helix bundle dimerization domain-containing protein n=1 Tax=Streptomyces sp. NBC_00654 TaxID=2975799 RepID=UPI00338DA05B
MLHRIAVRYAGGSAPETVVSYVEDCHALLAARATVTRHLPLLAGRFATGRLDALARADALSPAAEPPRAVRLHRKCGPAPNSRPRCCAESSPRRCAPTARAPCPASASTPRPGACSTRSD